MLELTPLPLGEVIDYPMVGTAVEGSLGGLGWRLEGRYSRSPTGEEERFWVAGVQHQLEQGVVVDLEWYDNNLGATHPDQLEAVTPGPLQTAGLQPSLGRNLLGLSLAQDLTPLLQGQYTLLISPLQSGRSQLHQLNLNYSLGDESDLLLSMQFHQGAGLEAGRKRLELGHLNDRVTLRFQHYF